MLTLAANLSLLFTEIPLEARFEQAAIAGFRQVEMQFPYALPVARLCDLLRDNGLDLVLFNAPAGDVAGGERGLVLGEEEPFVQSIEVAATYLAATHCPAIHVMIGNVAPGERPDDEAIARRLASAARRFQGLGVRLLLEPLNAIDQPHYALQSMRHADTLRALAGEPNIALQLDGYHAVRSGQDPVLLLDRYADHVGHIQVADGPDRGEPDSAAMTRFLDALAARGWEGPVGCEYQPRGGTVEGLGWAARFGLEPTFQGHTDV